MSLNKSYYSATENDNKYTALKIVLSLCLVALVVLGAVFTYNYASKQIKLNQIDTEIGSQSSQSVINVLVCVLDKDNKNLDPKFTLVGFDNDSQTITVGEIPANETIVGKEKKLSAKGHFEYGGARYLRDAIVNHYGIVVQKYISASLPEVETFVDKLGGVNYNIKQTMQFANQEGNLITNLVKGKQKLNGNQYCQFLRYDKWKSAKQKRQNREDLLATLLNEHIAEFDSETILKIYKSVANKIDTDISIVEMNDFSIDFASFLDATNPVICADIDYSDSEISRALIKKMYE